MTIKDYNEQRNKILEYFDSSDFVNISDSVKLLRYEQPNRVGYFLKPLSTDSTKKTFTYNVKEGIVKTKNYQLDLLWMIVNSEKGRNVYSWLNTYDNKRNRISHLDFADWSEEKKSFVSGKIDCDTTLHLYLNDRNEHRLFEIDEMGNIIFIEREKTSK